MTRPTAAQAVRPRVQSSITSENLDDPALFADLASTSEGAVLIFRGRVREANEGRRVASMTYEAYEAMAERELADICHEAVGRFEVGAVSAAHRVGNLELGETSVAIAVASAHRDPCYAASRWIIEQIKERLPVWKHEHLVDGTSVWIGAPGEVGVPAARGDATESGR
ncbi:MAG: molybdenum cofactor biosynthesis protein MoaE [Gemmatimonadota bacterium]|nr:molybdenum cofactor biosynthesis protein MoaE [Gemmatimonadota bacterium]